MNERHLSAADRLLLQVDQALRTVFGVPITTERGNPAEVAPEAELEETARLESMRLMRVNHCGEICAQALYQGQALTARTARVRQAMERAAAEENDHLDWCAKRVRELEGHTTYLGPLFYLGSLSLGATAGLAGDKWSLGFLAETEHQVVRHLEGHLQRLPADDSRSRVVVEQMIVDEGGHATTAIEAGGTELPRPIPRLMALASKLMTGSSYWI